MDDLINLFLNLNLEIKQIQYCGQGRSREYFQQRGRK